MRNVQKITPFLWFDGQAEEATKFYTSIFNDSRIVATLHYDEASAQASGQPPGSILTVDFELEGQRFTALNGGPQFQFTPAISFAVHCRTQKELDYYWEQLSAGGDPAAQQCGWLKDKFDFSWQIVPAVLPELIGDPDSEKAGRAMQALMQMKKLDIAALERAHAGEASEPGASIHDR